MILEEITDMTLNLHWPEFRLYDRKSVRQLRMAKS